MRSSMYAEDSRACSSQAKTRDLAPPTVRAREVEGARGAVEVGHPRLVDGPDDVDGGSVLLAEGVSPRTARTPPRSRRGSTANGASLDQSTCGARANYQWMFVGRFWQAARSWPEDTTHPARKSGRVAKTWRWIRPSCEARQVADDVVGPEAVVWSACVPTGQLPAHGCTVVVTGAPVRADSSQASASR